MTDRQGGKEPTAATAPTPEEAAPDPRYEYWEDVIDLETVGFPVSLLPLHVKVTGTYRDEAPIARMRFYCLSRDRGDWRRAEDAMWETVRPAIVRRYGELVKGGWEAARPLDREIIERELGQDTRFIMLQLLFAVLTIGVSYAFTHDRKDFYFRARAARLPLRRLRSG
jgi:hypothetical protein